MKKRLLALVMCGMLCVSVVACGTDKGGSDKDEEKTESVDDSGDSDEADDMDKEEASVAEDSDSGEREESENVYEQVALDFVYVIGDKDYEAVRDLIELESPEFVTVDDIEKGLYASEYKDLIGASGDVSVTESTEDYKSATVTVSRGGSEYTIALTEVDGDYRVDDSYSGILIHDCPIKVTRNVTATIDGEDISGYFTENEAEDGERNFAVYTIPDIGVCDKEITLSAEGLPSYTTEVLATSDGIGVWYALDEDFAAQVFDDYKTLMNDVFADTYNNATVDALQPYFWSNATGDDLSVVADYLSEYKSDDGKHVKMPMTLTYVGDYTAHTEPGVQPAVYVYDGTGVIHLNMAVTKEWTLSNGGYEDEKVVNLWVSTNVIYEDGELRLMPLWACDDCTAGVWNDWYSTDWE